MYDSFHSQNFRHPEDWFQSTSIRVQLKLFKWVLVSVNIGSLSWSIATPNKSNRKNKLESTNYRIVKNYNTYGGFHKWLNGDAPNGWFIMENTIQMDEMRTGGTPMTLETSIIWLWINTYTYHFQGDEHPFSSYFDVHQGDRVLTHPHILVYPSRVWWCPLLTRAPAPFFPSQASPFCSPWPAPGIFGGKVTVLHRRIRLKPLW